MLQKLNGQWTYRKLNNLSAAGSLIFFPASKENAHEEVP